MSQASPDTPCPTNAPHPFNLPSGDLILRTADLVDFRVHAPILALASPFFATMLALPQPAASTTSCARPASEERGATQVVPVSEDSPTLELLLRLVYPISKPRAKMEDPQLVVPVLQAAAKYEMELPVDILSERLIAIVPKSPLQVWAAACRTGLEDVARQAAVALRTSWTRDGTNEVLSFMGDLGDMSGISAADYLRLKQFLKANQSVVDEGKLTLLSPSVVSASAPQSGSSESPLPFSTRLPSPDVVCRSSSRVGSHTSFAAHQVVLSMYSPVLEARLAELRNVPLSHGSPTPTSIVLDFDEEADMLSNLLKTCYEGEEGLSPDLGLAPIAGLLRACRMYQMTRITRWVRVAWDREALRCPLEAYFVAINHGLDECAKAAAKNVLTDPIANVYAAAMESAPALAYHNLLIYFDACRQASRERFLEASNQIPERLYSNNGYIYLTDIKNALESFNMVTHGASPTGASKDALIKTLAKCLSGCNGYAGNNLRKFLDPLFESMTSVPDAAAAELDAIAIQIKVT